ncbi:MFS transporter [Georgenia thermotolerans]|uniref:MFS transporter n=1 Tax=Georgenia thermotolerans TaxID=527326 RepID=UPI001D01DA25|nr:MFS transporter [Georgenia thermotolerans]
MSSTPTSSAVTQPSTDADLAGTGAGEAAVGQAAAAGAGQDTADGPGLRAALTRGLGDPVLRVLMAATAVSTLGRGVFFTLTVLYFTSIVGLSAAQVALILAASSGVGVVTSLLGGHLADRVSARALCLVLTLTQGAAVVAYTAATTFAVALTLACLAAGASSAEHSARSAIIARAFDGGARVGARAVLRTVTNIGIAVGSALAGAALVLDTAPAYRVTMALAGATYLFGAFLFRRLPARVDAPRREATAEAAVPAGRSPFRDPRYLLLTALSGLFGMQFALAEVGLPLWVSEHTSAPTVVVSAALVLNTVIVIAFQIPLSRGTEDPAYAGRMMVLAGLLMLAACLGYAASGAVGAVLAVAVVLLAMAAHSFAEVLSSAATWGLSFELADPARAGAYQGLFAMGYNVGAMLAPVVVAATALRHGVPGWAGLGVMFLAVALGVAWIGRRAARVAR